MASSRPSPCAVMVIRTGNSLVYIHDRELALGHLQRLHSQPLSSEDMSGTQDLLHFEGKFIELVSSHMNSSFTSASAALAAAKPHIPYRLANTVRNMLRARGAAAHPVPQGKCPRVLRELQCALACPSSSSASSSPSPETTNKTTCRTSSSSATRSTATSPSPPMSATLPPPSSPSCPRPSSTPTPSTTATPRLASSATDGYGNDGAHIRDHDAICARLSDIETSVDQVLSGIALLLRGDSTWANHVRAPDAGPCTALADDFCAFSLADELVDQSSQTEAIGMPEEFEMQRASQWTQTPMASRAHMGTQTVDDIITVSEASQLVASRCSQLVVANRKMEINLDMIAKRIRSLEAR